MKKRFIAAVAVLEPFTNVAAMQQETMLRVDMAIIYATSAKEAYGMIMYALRDEGNITISIYELDAVYGLILVDGDICFFNDSNNYNALVSGGG